MRTEMESRILERNQVIDSLQAALVAEKEDKAKVQQSTISDMQETLENRLAERNEVVQSLQAALAAEKEDKLTISSQLQLAIAAEKEDKAKVQQSTIGDMQATMEARVQERNDVIQSLQAALSAEKEDKLKVINELQKAISSEKEDKAKVQQSTIYDMQTTMEKRLTERNEVIQSLQSALAAEKEDKLKISSQLQLAIAAEKEDKAKVQQSTIAEMQLTMEKRLAERNAVIQSLQTALEAEKHDKSKVTLELKEAIAQEKIQKANERLDVTSSLREVIELEKAEKQKVVSSLQAAVQAEKEDKAIIKENFLVALEAERLELAKLKLSLQESKFLEMNELKEKFEGMVKNSILEKDQIIQALKDRIEFEINERHNTVNSLRNAVNHEILEKEKVVNNLIISLDYEKRERERTVQDITSSLSYKLGRFITLPARIPYNVIAHPDKSKVVLFMKFIGSGLRRPQKAIASVNRQNIKTLKSALQRENPEEILKNYNKHLNKDKLEKAQVETAKNQQKFFEETQKTSNVAPAAAVVATATMANVIAQKTDTIESETIDSTPTNNSGNKTNDTHSIDNLMGFKEDRLKAQVLANIKGKKILFISPNLPDYDTSSGGKRATRMLQLMAQECDVYAYARGARQQKYIDKLASVNVTFIPEYDYDKVKAQHPEFDIIIYAWYYTLHESHAFIDLYPKAKLICDTVDIHWVREERSLGLWEGLTTEKVQENKNSEIAAYRQADIIWAVTEPDRQAVLKEIPFADVRVVSNIHDAHFTDYTDSGTNNMLFFGGFNHYPNISAAKLLVEKILPQVRQSVPDAQLILAGANAPEDIIALGDIEGVQYLGFIEEDDVEKLYKSSKLCVAPLLAGAGIKGKICESIAYMLPIVTNGIGNEGIQLENGTDGLITEDFYEMSQMIIAALQGKYDLEQMTKRAQDKLFKLVGSSIVKENMLLSIPREVSICIVTWNRLDMLKDCLDSMLEKTMYPFYKILVHSNGCEDGTQEYLRELGERDARVIPILSKENEVFVLPNNKMMDLYPHNDVVLVNNDVTVELNWLNALVNAAYMKRNIGLSGSKILYPDGTLQEFGSELYGDGTGRNIGKWDDNPNKEEYSKITYVGYVSGCSLYIKRTTIKRIGKFDEQFHPCYCEDSDLCYTAWENDLHTVVTPFSIINHFEGGTSGKDEDSGFKSYQKINFDKFLAKHRDNLDSIKNKIDTLNKSQLS